VERGSVWEFTDRSRISTTSTSGFSSPVSRTYASSRRNPLNVYRRVSRSGSSLPGQNKEPSWRPSFSVPADWTQSHLHKVAAERTLTRLVSFYYGQRHKKELDYATRCALHLGVPHNVVDVTAVGRLLTGSRLTTDKPVPQGHYAEDSMRDGRPARLSPSGSTTVAVRAVPEVAAVHVSEPPKT
jgi:hypothetical protein